MESILFNLFWSLIGGIAFLSIIALILVVDKLTNNKIDNFIIKMYE